MIITPVQKVKSCKECPNFRSSSKGVTMVDQYICLADNIMIGSSDSMTSRLNLANKVSDLCPFRNDEVNQKPVRN